MLKLVQLYNETLAGWKFRPYVQNPYYKLADEDEEELEMESMVR